MKDLRGLHADLEVRVVVFVQYVHMAHRRFDQSLGRRFAVLALQVLAHAIPALTPMRIGIAAIASRGYNLAHLVVAADVARIDTQAVHTVLRDLECNAMVESGYRRPAGPRTARGYRETPPRPPYDGTETRTISAPAASRALIWATVAATSQVSVLVMLCTLIGASPPTATLANMNLAALAPLDR
jgi:hypothetical protein